MNDSPESGRQYISSPEARHIAVGVPRGDTQSHPVLRYIITPGYCQRHCQGATFGQSPHTLSGRTQASTTNGLQPQLVHSVQLTIVMTDGPAVTRPVDGIGYWSSSNVPMFR